MATENQPFEFACPHCLSGLEQISLEELSCPTDQFRFNRLDGIWRLLPPERLAYYEQFIREYELIRRTEGRGSTEPAYYRALPYTDLSGRRVQDWRIRGRSYQAFVVRFLEPIESGGNKPLKIIDAGAGNGWLSYRLSQRGHQVAAVDLLVNSEDGLGVHRHYGTSFISMQAEFDRLPFSDSQFDLLVYNASFHYAVDYYQVLREARRVLKPGASIVIMDSPVYRDGKSGIRMVQEREEQFAQRFGFPSNALPSKNFLTYSQINQLSGAVSLFCRLITPAYGLRWQLRPILARLMGKREPARFHLIVMQVPG